MPPSELIESMLAGVAEQAPCGPNLEYDDDFLQLQKLASGKPEQQYGETIIPAEPADWLAVERLAAALFARTKDLRVAALLARSWTELRGIAGYADGLHVVSELVDKYWDSVYPLLADDGEYDPTPRTSALAEVAGPHGCARIARQQALVAGSSGSLSVRDAERVLDGASAEVDHYPGGADRLSGDLLRAQEEPQSALKAGLAALDALDAIRAQVEAKLGMEWTLDASDFEKALLRIRRDVLRPLANETHEAVPEAGATDGAAQVARDAGLSWRDAELASRDDVRLGLEKMCRYFEVNEPSHPAPILLRRAQRLLGLDFYEIIRDLAPEGLHQLEALGGQRRSE